MAKLVPLRRPVARRTPGGWEGRARIAEDFDARLTDDILEAFDG